MTIRLSILLVVAGLPRSAGGQIRPVSQAPGAYEARRQEYSALSRRIFAGPEEPDWARRAVNSVPAAQVDEITARLHDLVTVEVEDALAGPRRAPQDVERAIRYVIGETSLTEWSAQATNTPFAAFARIGGAQVLAAAFGILRGGGALPNTRPYLEFYAQENGVWRLAAEAPPDFDRRTFFLSPVPAGLAEQAWFLAWGREFGDTGGRLRVRLYAFDGRGVRTIWQRDDLTWGSVTVSGRSVTLEYDREYHSAERTRETLYVEPDGLR
jgi:hypothetical protein